jgi:hypothetical protein
MMVIGLDFDNTIVSYDALVHSIALKRGLIEVYTDAAKRTVRDRIRQLPDGEVEWQKLQALVYGPLMTRASLIDGVREFVRRCHDSDVRVHVVSHKTEFAAYDSTHTNLRTAALEWMAAHAFFDREGLALRYEDVHFESTREAKIARIVALGCTHFLDDLEEVFSEASFPPTVEKLLYVPDGRLDLAGEMKVIPTWTALHEYFFGDRA